MLGISMRESIFMSSLRTFFMAFFGIAGLIIGIILIVALVGGISGTSDGQADINYTYTPEIVPNAEGVRKELSSDAPVILKLTIEGVIGVDQLTRQAIESQLIESRERSFKNNRVKAVLLSIDSPGGTVTDADGIYRLIKAYKEKYKVPVYAFADGLCASGGMYIASAADKIYASDTTLVGSVGVIMPTVLNFSQLLEKVGVQTLTIYDGKGKDNLNPLRPWKEGEEDNIKAAISYYYTMFVDVVTSNRPKLDKTKLINDYGANIYPAAIAKEHGYIDESGVSENQALKELAKAIGIEDEYYQVIQFRNKSWSTLLFGHNIHGLLSGKVTHQIELCPDMNTKLMNQYLYLYRP
jgi:protease IV